jgi:hypothetical protein
MSSFVSAWVPGSGFFFSLVESAFLQKNVINGLLVALGVSLDTAETVFAQQLMRRFNIQTFPFCPS